MKKIKLINMTPADLFHVITGCIIYGAAVNIFIIPNNIAPGGATGTSMILNHFTGVSVGTWVLLLNIPLFLISIKSIGLPFFRKTLVSTFLFSAFIDIFSFLPVYNDDVFLAGVFGGALSGLGLSFIFGRGIMTGGSDLLARLIKQKYHHLSLGKLILIIDAVVILAATITFKNITDGMYAVVSIYISTHIIDAFLLGIDKAKATLIVTEKANSISSKIVTSLGRTSTVIPAVGGFSDKKKELIVCIVRRYELYKLKNIIRETDEHAFFMVFDAGEVIGEGFKSHLENDR